MAEPRKLTIKIRKPGETVAAKPMSPAAPAPAPAAPAPAPAPVAEAPAPTPAAEPAMAPIPETPVSIASVAETAQQAKRQTSRIELPPEITQPPVMSGSEDVTIKLKPVSQATTPESPDAAQATKSKTARIALDTVLGGIQSDAPLANTTQKTIKLKRAVPAGGTKSVVSSPIKPITPAVTGEEKTVKLKRPVGLTLPKKDAPKPVEPELEQLESLDDDSLAPLPDLAAPVAESAGAKAFTIIGVVAAAFAIIATIALCIILQKQAASPNGDLPTGNTLHSLPFQRI